MPKTRADKSPLVSIIVVTMDTPEMTGLCLESLVRHTKVPHEFIVVCNGPGRGIKNRLKKFRGIQILQNKKNLGYTKAANQGAVRAAGKFLCFVNSDAIVPARWLERLLKPASLPGVGAVAAERWGQPRFMNSKTREALASLADQGMQKWRGKEFKEAEKICGFCLLIPRPVMASTGPFDERFFFGNEDIDYSLRLRLRGYKLILAESLFVSHIGGASSTRAKYLQLVRASEKAFIEKWNGIFKKRLLTKEAVLAYAAKKIASNQKTKAVKFSGARSQKKSVTVSVMMAAHNAQAWIAEAIESVLAQNFRDFELIVVDDGSTDRTAEIVRRYRKHPELRFFQNQTQMGIPATRNKILKLSRGKYIAVCDADDAMRPSFLKHFTEFMEKNPKTGWVYGNRVAIDEAGQPLARVRALAMNGRIEYKRNVMQHAGAMIRKSLMVRAGGYDESFNSCEDYDLAFKIAARSEVKALPGEPQYLYRWHPENTSRNNPWARRETDILVARAKA